MLFVSSLASVVEFLKQMKKSSLEKPSATYRFFETHNILRTLKFLGIQLLTFPIYLSFLPQKGLPKSWKGVFMVYTDCDSAAFVFML